MPTDLFFSFYHPQPRPFPIQLLMPASFFFLYWGFSFAILCYFKRNGAPFVGRCAARDLCKVVEAPGEFPPPFALRGTAYPLLPRSACQRAKKSLPQLVLIFSLAWRWVSAVRPCPYLGVSYSHSFFPLSGFRVPDILPPSFLFFSSVPTQLDPFPSVPQFPILLILVFFRSVCPV